MSAASLSYQTPDFHQKPLNQRRAWLIGLFLLGMACELIVPTAASWWYKPDGEEPFIAQHLYHGHGFRSPLDLSAAAPPTSWSPPVYPVIVSVFYHLFGVKGRRVIVALALLHAVFFGLVTIGLFRLGETLVSRQLGIAAATAHALYPAFLKTACDFWDSYAALTIFVWLLVAAAILRKREPRLREAAGLGFGLGLLSLTNASYALAYPVMVLAAARGRGWMGRLVFAGAALLVFVLTIAPWTIRNYNTFGRLFYIRDGVKFELWLGNLPRTTGWFTHGTRDYHPTHNAAERHALLTEGESAYFDDCVREFKANYHADPSRFWTRTACRIAFSFAGEPDRRPGEKSTFAYAFSGVAHEPLNAVLTCLGLAGAVLARRRRMGLGWLLAVGLLAVTPFVFASVYGRYLLPLRVIFAFFAAYLVVAVMQRTGRRSEPGRVGPDRGDTPRP